MSQPDTITGVEAILRGVERLQAENSELKRALHEARSAGAFIPEVERDRDRLQSENAKLRAELENERRASAEYQRRLHAAQDEFKRLRRPGADTP